MRRGEGEGGSEEGRGRGRECRGEGGLKREGIERQ